MKPTPPRPPKAKPAKAVKARYYSGHIPLQSNEPFFALTATTEAIEQMRQQIVTSLLSRWEKRLRSGFLTELAIRDAETCLASLGLVALRDGKKKS